MKYGRFNEEQIIAILKEQVAGVPAVDVCRRHGVSSATFYTWKAKFGGLEVSEANRDGPTARWRGYPFDRACWRHDIEHRLTKPKHPWTNGQVERMNRTIKGRV